jgi:hypothetical protein
MLTVEVDRNGGVRQADLVAGAPAEACHSRAFVLSMELPELGEISSFISRFWSRLRTLSEPGVSRLIQPITS